MAEIPLRRIPKPGISLATKRGMMSYSDKTIKSPSGTTLATSRGKRVRLSDPVPLIEIDPSGETVVRKVSPSIIYTTYGAVEFAQFTEGMRVATSDFFASSDWKEWAADMDAAGYDVPGMEIDIRRADEAVAKALEKAEGKIVTSQAKTLTSGDKRRVYRMTRRG
jgi:hypothetical protein